MKSLNYKHALESGADAFWVKSQKGEWKNAEYWEFHKLRGNNLHPEVVNFEFLPVFIPSVEQLLSAADAEVEPQTRIDGKVFPHIDVLLPDDEFKPGDKVIIMKVKK
jgi:hypothetical protein